MGMPNDLILVRHGQSEGNVATDASKNGDDSWYTDTFMTTPGHQWRLTKKGRAQAATTGAWIAEELGSRFDRYFVSPYVRTQETAAMLDLPGAQWRLNRAFRERDWGSLDSLPKSEFKTRPEYQRSAVLQRVDPLYWRARDGESIAQVAEDRVRNILDTLHREASGQRVVAVTHGELMWAFRLVLERLSDAEFAALDADKSERIHNAEALHYSRINPETGAQAGRLMWVRRARPVEDQDGAWSMLVSPWRKIEFRTYSNDDLLAFVNAVPSLAPTLPATGAGTVVGPCA